MSSFFLFVLFLIFLFFRNTQLHMHTAQLTNSFGFFFQKEKYDLQKIKVKRYTSRKKI